MEVVHGWQEHLNVVTLYFFHTLGVGPELGRLLDVSDDAPKDVPAAAVSWR